MPLKVKLGSQPISLFLLQPHHHHPTKKPAPPSHRPFEELLTARLRSLLPVPGAAMAVSSPIPLDWLSRAAGVLSLTIADAGALIISDPSLLRSDAASLSRHLDATLALLDACNAASAEIDRLLHARLHLRLAIHLLLRRPISGDSTAAGKARAAISEWEGLLIRDRRHQISISTPISGGDLSRGKASVVRRAIYAVEAVSELVASSVAAALGDGFQRIGVVAGGDFPWSDPFNEISAAVSGRIAPAAEVAAVETKVRDLAAAFDGVAENGGQDAAAAERRIRAAAEETEKSTEEMTEALERLSDAVNGTFRAALAARNAALKSSRAATVDPVADVKQKKNNCVTRRRNN